MATKKAAKGKSRTRVKTLSTKSLTARQARTVKGGDTPTTTTTKPSGPFVKIKIIEF